MAKVRLSLLLISFLGLLACPLGSQAATGHSISITSVTSNPSPPRVGEAVDILTIRFNLTAQSGVDVNRIKIFFDNGTSAFPTSAGDFTVTPNVNHPDTKALIVFKTEGVTFSQANTKIKVSYCLTSFNCNTTLASALINQNAIGSDSGNSGSGNGGTGNGNTSNGSVSQAPHVFFLDVEEVTNGDAAVVSLEPKQFRLIVEHDKNYIDSVTDSNFNPDTNAILSNLVITSTNTFTGEKTKVTDEYIFDLDSASIASLTRPNYLITEYISTNKVIKNGQKLKFNINLQKNFFEKFGIPVVNGAILRDSATITIEPLTGTLNSIAINPSSISFSNIGKSKGKSNYISETVNINADLNSDDTASTIANVDFFRLNTSGNKIKPKLSINSKKVLNIRPSLSGNASINNNGANSSITLPLDLETSGKEKTLVQQGFNDSSKSKTLKIPLTITTNTTNGLDLIFTGTLNSTVDTNFEETGANGNSL